jgi:hypothetical protein
MEESSISTNNPEKNRMPLGKLLGPEELFDENSRGKKSHEKKSCLFCLTAPHLTSTLS